MCPGAFAVLGVVGPGVLSQGAASFPKMRKLIVQQWATADGIVAEDGGGLGFVPGDPFAEDDASAFKESVMGFIDTVDTIILGANTYAMTKDYWPNATEQGEYGRKLNELAKYVASSKLASAPWGDFPAATVTRDPVATVKELKSQPGKDIWLWGSLTLMRSLIDAGVVDEVQLRVCPTVLGSGVRMFETRRDVEPLEATLFDNGVTLLRYGLDG